MNFVIIDGDRHHLRKILQQIVPSFFSSIECLDLDECSRTNDGVLVAAFTRYTERMITQENSSEIEHCAAFVERLSGSDDPEVVNYVYTEIFDNLRVADHLVQEMVRLLGPKSRALYADWLQRRSSDSNLS